MNPDLHRLVGLWKGEGVAEYPTIERVEYHEELSIEYDEGRGVLCYEQRAVLADGSPSHRETGFIEMLPDGSIQLWNAQDNGRVEVLVGAIAPEDDGAAMSIDLRSVAFGNDARMLRTTRTLRVDDSRLSYEVLMATTTVTDEELRPHLRARLRRVASR